MRHVEVVTNRTCNQNCGFCTSRRAHEDATSAAIAVLARVQAAIERGPQEIVLTGGEPTLRRDLPVLVRAAAAGARVVVETNAALLDEVKVSALARAGLGRARVRLARWGDAADEITLDPGGFRRTLAGIRALRAAGIPVEISTPVLAANAGELPDLPTAVARSGVEVERILLRAVTDPAAGVEALGLRAMARVIAATERAARSAGIPLGLHPEGRPPPCAFDEPIKIAHLFGLGPGGSDRDEWSRVDGCERCAARAICPGVPRAVLAREPDLATTLAPITSERTRGRLAMVGSVEDQIARELVVRDVRRGRDGSVVRENIVRVGFRCNQDCGFCFVSTHLPAPERSAVEAAIREIGEIGGVLTLSGGEPTLVADLPDLVALGKRLGASRIEIQTNAMRLGDPALVASLRAAGLDAVFASLHASNADLSDAITGAPGTFEQTVRGLDEVAKTPLELILSFVTCSRNAGDFPAFVRLVAARWPRAIVALSLAAASTDVVPLEHIPRYSEVMPSIGEGLALAAELEVEVLGFESMCGLPLCLVPGDPARFAALAEAPDDGGEFLKTDTCARCALATRCFGVRRNYAALYGTSELRAVSAEELASASLG